MSDILKRILAVKRDEVAAAQAALPLAEVRAMAERQPAAVMRYLADTWSPRSVSMIQRSVASS